MPISSKRCAISGASRVATDHELPITPHALRPLERVVRSTVRDREADCGQVPEVLRDLTGSRFGWPRELQRLVTGQVRLSATTAKNGPSTATFECEPRSN